MEICREERIAQWVDLLTEAGITQTTAEQRLIYCNIEGPAVFPPQDVSIIVIPTFQDYLKVWEDEDEWKEIYDRLPKDDEDDDGEA